MCKPYHTFNQYSSVCVLCCVDSFPGQRVTSLLHPLHICQVMLTGVTCTRVSRVSRPHPRSADVRYTTVGSENVQSFVCCVQTYTAYNPDRTRATRGGGTSRVSKPFNPLLFDRNVAINRVGHLERAYGEITRHNSYLTRLINI